MIWPWEIFVSPEMLSKPRSSYPGRREEQFSMTVPFLGRFHREQATSYLWPSCSNISPGLCSSSFGNHRYYLPRHRNVHSTWSNGGTEPKEQSLCCVPACVGSPFLCPTPLPGPWGPGTWWWTRAEPTSLQWLKHHTEARGRNGGTALRQRQMAAKCKSNGCRWWAWGWKMK